MPSHLRASALLLHVAGEHVRYALRLLLGTEVCGPNGFSNGPKHLGQETLSGYLRYDPWLQCATLKLSG